MRILAKLPRVGLLALAPVLALLLTACAQSTPQPAAPSGEAPGAPKRGGTFVAVGDPTTLGADFHRATSINHIVNFPNVHGSLLELSPEDRTTIRGDLAESWELGKDGKTYTFKIRKGLVTHKGKPFGAEDIVYNIERMLKRPNGLPMPRTGCIRADVESVTSPDPQTVVVQLKGPSASFPACLTNPYVSMQPKYLIESVDRENRKMQYEELDGVGPFKLKEWVDGSLAKWERYDGFFKEGRPYLDEFWGISLPDAAAQIAAFRTQRIHMFSPFATTPAPSEAKSLKTEFGDRITVNQAPAPGFRGFQINWKRPPLDDIRVREAIDLAADRKNQLEFAYEGAGFVSGPYYGWDWVYSFEEMSKWPGYRADKTQDLERARQLLKDAGYGNGLIIEVLTGTTSPDDTDILAEDLKKVGITVKLNRQEAKVKADLDAKAEFMLTYQGNGAEYDDPDSLTTLSFLPTSGENYGRWEDPEFLRLYAQQRAELDQTKRGQILRKMADIIRDSHAYVFMNRPLLHQTWWSYVKGYVAPKSFYQTSYRWDHIWLDK